jgi:hypothetical protein
MAGIIPGVRTLPRYSHAERLRPAGLKPTNQRRWDGGSARGGQQTGLFRQNPTNHHQSHPYTHMSYVFQKC